MGWAQRAARAGRVAAGLPDPLLISPAEVEDRAEADADALEPVQAGRLDRATIVRLMQDDTTLNSYWPRFGNAQVFDFAATVIAGTFDLAGAIDIATSERLAATSRDGAFCYWNAAKALLTDRELSGCEYVEGVWIAPGILPARQRSSGVTVRVLNSHQRHVRKRGALSIELEGFLMNADGEVIDPTAVLVAERCAGVDVRDALERSVFVPVRRYSREEVADRWEEIPLSLADDKAKRATLRTLTACMDAFNNALGQAALFQGNRTARWAPPRGR